MLTGFANRTYRYLFAAQIIIALVGTEGVELRWCEAALTGSAKRCRQEGAIS